MDRAESWGGYMGVDAAIFQEVIEHLDPTPLRWLGACLLAALSPRLLLLSTPNFEYNVVMRRLQPGSMLPNGLRNSDHRFEWYFPTPTPTFTSNPLSCSALPNL